MQGPEFNLMGEGINSPRKPGGFSLVITVMMMVLLALLALGLLGLSTISLRSSNRDALNQAARSNARMSLMLAIGEVQRLAGPDQRVTAPAGVLERDSSYVSNRHLVGVWRGWRNDPEQVEDPKGHKEADFLGWLGSGIQRDAGLDEPKSEPPGETIELVGEGSVMDGSDRVSASLVTVGEWEGIQGSYAWTVLDESTKAMVKLPDVVRQSFQDELAGLGAPAVPGYATVEDQEKSWVGLEEAGDDRLKLITSGQLPLLADDLDRSSFHDLTPWSLGLMVNAAEGGFQKDLSLLFDRGELPADFSRRYLYSDKNGPLLPPPPRFSGANVLPSPDPSWRLLHSHANLYREVQTLDREPTIGTKVAARPPAGFPASRSVEYPGFHRQNLSPVIAKAQFIFSIGFGSHLDQKYLQQIGLAKKDEDLITWLVIDPVITLWNPYDVSLTFESGALELYRIPMAFQIMRNGVSFAPPTLFADAYHQVEFGVRKEKGYTLRLKPGFDESGREEERIVMQPGEHLVFTAHNQVKHNAQSYHQVGVDLRPGWNPAAGMDSNKHVGGVTAFHMFVDSAGNNSARINGQSSRWLPVKAGDRLTLAVSRAHANVDKLSETNKREVSAFLRYYIESDGESSGSTPPFVGAIELDYGEQEKDILTSIDSNDLPEIIVPRGVPTTPSGDNYAGTRPPAAVCTKEPFLIASLHLKTALDSRFPSRAWLQNSPTNLYSSMGLDQQEDPRHHQYEFEWEPMTDWNSSPTVELDTEDRGYGALGIYAQSGVSFAPFASVPLAPLISMGQLRHAPINLGGQLPLQAQVISNSFASPLLAPDKVRATEDKRTYFDHSFYANSMLFDRWFFSSVPPVGNAGQTGSASLEGFLAGGQAMANPRFVALHPIRDADELASELRAEDGYLKIASRLGLAGGFNVNSMSVDAWRAVLASLQAPEIPVIEPQTGLVQRTGGDGTLVSRHVPPTGQTLDGVTDPIESQINVWAGHRRLTDAQIERLAIEVVEQVRRRGPFQSLAEFVNRRPSSGDLALSGALQAAIDAAGLNDAAVAGAMPVDADPDAAFPKATEGTTADGAPGTINQADLLVPLAPMITVRGDTFVIRSYGEARKGSEVARAWCEAVVQRLPAYVDEGLDPLTNPSDLPAEGVSARFGRRFQVVSFRWLRKEEV